MFSLSQTKESYLRVKKTYEKIYERTDETEELNQIEDWKKLTGKGKYECEVWEYTKDYDKDHNPRYYKVVKANGEKAFFKRRTESESTETK